MANLKPAHGGCATVEYPLTTVSATRGYPLGYIGTPGNAGYVGPGAPTSAVGIIAVAAETKNGVISGRSALASTTGDGDHVILGYPATINTQFLAVCSGTPVVADLDVAHNVSAAGLVIRGTSTEEAFVIDRIVDATTKTVIGRFISGHYIPRVLTTVGS